MIALSLKHDVLNNDFSAWDTEVSRERDRSTQWGIAKDLSQQLDAMDFYVCMSSTAPTDEEDFVLMSQHSPTYRTVLLRGYVLSI